MRDISIFIEFKKLLKHLQSKWVFLSIRLLAGADGTLNYLRRANQNGHYFEYAKLYDNNYSYQSEVELVLQSLELAWWHSQTSFYWNIYNDFIIFVKIV